MRVLLDEDVPRRLGRELAGHDVSTVQGMGWAGFKNGALLSVAAAAGFEVLLTCDRGMQYQQNVSALSLAVVVLAVPDKKLGTIHALVPQLLSLLDAPLASGTFSVVGDWRA